MVDELFYLDKLDCLLMWNLLCGIAFFFLLWSSM